MIIDSIETYRTRLRSLAAQVAELGFVAQGSLISRPTLCGRAGCRCGGDPPRPHGPYWQLTRKVAGKTVTTRLSEPQAVRYAEWIANNHKLRQIVAEMEQVSAEAAAAILARDASAT